MDALELARWQFGVTTVYHYLFVPITIGMVFLVAGMHTAWHRTGDERWLRLTKLFGKLFLINFAMGVVTGIVQEFQFGMNWSNYSRFVGDVFGAPLAMEALLAFFLESTFIGLWIFGWDRLPRRVHLATIWAAAIGTALSAYFILAANSWMQYPVGFRINTEAGRAELTDIGAVLTSKSSSSRCPHMAGAFLTGGAIVVAVALCTHAPPRPRRRTRLPIDIRLGSGGAVAAWYWRSPATSKVVTEVQPMKMAPRKPCSTPKPRRLLRPDHQHHRRARRCSLRVPSLLSWLATGDPNAPSRASTTCKSPTRTCSAPARTCPTCRSRTGASDS